MKNYWLKSGFYSLLNQLTQMVFNLGSVIILWRVLDKESCSVWVIYMTITAFIEVGRTGLLQNGLMTYLNQTPQYEHAKINKASLFLNLSLSVLVVLMLLLCSSLVGSFYQSSELTVLLSIYAATTFVLSALYQFNFIQQANMDFKGLFWSSFVRNGSLFFYILYTLVSENNFSLTNLAFVQLLAAIPAAIVAYGFAKKYFSLKADLDWTWVKKLLHYGKYTFGTNLSTMAYKNVDKMMLGKLLLGTLSTYDLSIKINNLAEVPTTTLAAILFPQSARRTNTEGVEGAKYLYEKSVGVLMALIVPVVIFILLFADVIVWIIGSEKYASSTPILRLTIFYGIFMAFAMQFGTILDSVGKPKLNFYITTLGAAMNLTCNYFFINWFGLYGAAYGSLVAMTIMFVIMQSVLHRLFNVQILNVFHYMMSFYKEFWQKGKQLLQPKLKNL
ncbi:MAG: oligosaccharide flippase family protein [Saprospiraceae bacterium]|nr:oligosaccharide flippase family protein [Saprospiraceae bacterium]